MGEVLTHREATISDCGRYRYRLVRDWTEDGAKAKAVCFVMLNPSTADAEVDDPTIRRCVGFAKTWGYTRLIVVNLFAFRATDPKVLAAEIRREQIGAGDAMGPDNQRHLLTEATGSDLVIAAWGAFLTANGVALGRYLADLGIQLHCLAMTKAGAPVHPLYQPANRVPFAWGPLAIEEVPRG